MNCPNCGRTVDDQIDQEAVEDWGHCLMCDKLDHDRPLEEGFFLERED